MTIEDESGDVQCVLWPRVFARYRRALRGSLRLPGVALQVQFPQRFAVLAALPRGDAVGPRRGAGGGLPGAGPVAVAGPLVPVGIFGFGGYMAMLVGMQLPTDVRVELTPAEAKAWRADH